MSRLEDLSPEQRDSYNMFVDITNWQQDPNLAIVLLRSLQWNVEMAVMAHFDGVDPSQINVQQPAAPRVTSRPTSLLEELNNTQSSGSHAPRINPNPPVYAASGGGMSIIQAVLFAPFNIGIKMFNTLFYFLSWLFPFFPRLTGYYPANRTAHHTSDNIDPKNTASRFVRTFEEMYGPTEIPFYQGGYTDALEKAKSELKHLVLVIQSYENDLTSEFSRSVLIDPSVVSFFQREDVIVWGGNVEESEAYQVASGLEATKFPFTALIAPSPKTPTSSVLVMSVLAKFQGTVSADEFLASLQEKIDAHHPQLQSLILDREERELSRQLREEQDSAYERSLAADRLREKERQELSRLAKLEQEEKLKAEEAKREQELRKENLKELAAQWRRWRAQELRNKPQPGPESARVGLRLLSGERVVEKFDATDSIESIYAFVECYELLKQEASELDDNSEPESYTHSYKFQLVSPMPRKVLEPTTDRMIRDEKAIWPNGSLVVELEDEEEES